MFSPELKQAISERIQAILKELDHPELPEKGEIKFLLHVDGAESWSWANIRNNRQKVRPVTSSLERNTSVSWG